MQGRLASPSACIRGRFSDHHLATRVQLFYGFLITLSFGFDGAIKTLTGVVEELLVGHALEGCIGRRALAGRWKDLVIGLVGKFEEIHFAEEGW